MKNLFFLAILGCLFVACEDNQKDTEKSPVELNFKLTYDGNPIHMFERVQYPDGNTIFFDRVDVFLSDVAFLDGDNKKKEVLDVAFFEFGSIQDAAAAQRGFTVEGAAELGTYERVQVGVGVEPSLNATTPSDHSTTHPLANNYWASWTSYIFVVLEGKIDTSGDGNPDTSFSYHIGRDAAFHNWQEANQITVESGKTTQLGLQFDLMKLFSKNGNNLDIIAMPEDHSNRPEVYDFIHGNFEVALSMTE